MLSALEIISLSRHVESLSCPTGNGGAIRQLGEVQCEWTNQESHSTRDDQGECVGYFLVLALRQGAVDWLQVALA